MKSHGRHALKKSTWHEKRCLSQNFFKILEYREILFSDRKVVKLNLYIRYREVKIKFHDVLFSQYNSKN